MGLEVPEHPLGLVSYLLIELSIAPGKALDDEGRRIEIDAVQVRACASRLSLNCRPKPGQSHRGCSE